VLWLVVSGATTLRFLLRHLYLSIIVNKVTSER
jgi:hypothetical protein